MDKVKKYASLCVSKWGSGEFGESELGRPDPFTVLSDETRLAITVLLCLKGPMTTKQIANELGLSPSTVLDHLKKLKEAFVIKEVEVPRKRYKRERYYDVNLTPYFKDEYAEIKRRIKNYADILGQTALGVFEKSLEELRGYIETTLMARHGLTLERDEVKNLLWVMLWHLVGDYISEKGVYRPPLQSPKKHYFYLVLKRPEDQE